MHTGKGELSPYSLRDFSTGSEDLFYILDFYSGVTDL